MKRLLLLFLIVLLCTGLGVGGYSVYRMFFQPLVNNGDNQTVNSPNPNNPDAIGDIEDPSAFGHSQSPTTVKTHDPATITEEHSESHQYYEFYSAFLEMSRSDFSGEPAREWNFTWEPVRVKILSYNPTSEDLIVKFIGPKNSPKYNEATSTVKIKCDPLLYYKKVYNGYFKNSTERYFDVYRLKYVDSDFKALLRKMDIPEYKNVTLFTYCVNESCNTIGNACMFEDLPEK